MYPTDTSPPSRQPLRHLSLPGWSRYALSLAISSVITAALLMLMQLAVKNDAPKLTTPPPSLPVDWVKILEEPKVEPTEPPKPPQVKDPPPTPAPPDLFLDGPTGFTEQFTPPQLPGPTPGASFADGDLLPVLTVIPDYPATAAQRGVEGWVIVEFTVDELGRVTAPRVIDSFPSRVFNTAALKAVKRYKYKPRVLHGSAVAVHGVKQRIVFNLTEA